MNKCLYTFPHKSREAMQGYLLDHESYGGWNHPYRQWSPLAWNVKIHRCDDMARNGAYKTSPEFDDAWDSYLEQSNEMFGWICEDMARHYLEGEYTTYPGNDQGDWKFCMAGRSGGHMILESWKGTEFIKGWSKDRWSEYIEGLDFNSLRTLYKAARCMDQDFSREAIAKDFDYHLNFRRNAWEEEYEKEMAFEKAKKGFEPCPQI